MSPFTFADGTYVPKNNWVCVPHLPLMTDPATYPDPETFNGFRFVGKDGVSSDSRFSHTSWSFPYWGSVKQGRYVKVSLLVPSEFESSFKRSDEVWPGCPLTDYLCPFSPARFFVSIAVKMIVIHFLENYEFKLPEKKIPKTVAYDILQMPHPLLAILIRKRKYTT